MSITLKPHNPKLKLRSKPALLSHLLTLLLGTPFLTTMLVLFGAPLTTHVSLTALCAAHMATLAIMPLVYVHGVDAQRWRDVAALMSPTDEVFGAACGTMVGAWIGAVPIPLDWDREWQRWPVTIVSGAYAGWAVGKVLGGTVLKGKRLEIN
jgi:GPI ethanolamine phosphate transferase 2/3 subunit F